MIVSSYLVSTKRERRTEDDVCSCGLLLEDVYILECAIDETYFGVDGCYLSAFVGISHVDCIFIFRVGFFKSVECVATNVACRAGTAIELAG